jgi:hypothetical protein
VRHSRIISTELGKRECPDRVYGLRETRNIELLLYDIATRRPDPEVSTDPGRRDQPSAVLFMNQPMNAKGDHQLFPFLVLEAKTGSSDEWHAINMQTAFSIRTFLNSQQQLYSRARALSDWKSRPMVWFFSNKGENWRLCAAYTEDAPAERDRVGNTVYVSLVPPYFYLRPITNLVKRVIDVWHGCITSRDGALQLLLLVDYIFDWARDKYREDIIGALRTVARGESDAASGIYTDTDIFSTVPLDRIHQTTQVTEDDSDLNSYISAQSPFLALDSPVGVFRHATFVESRYYCLYITRDNVKTFLQSATQTRVQALCRLILGQMTPSILTDPDTLDAIEEEWTGVSRSSASSYRPQAQEQFHVAMSFATYLSTQWHQIRELSVIAITRDAWKFLGDASGFKRKLRKPFAYDYYEKKKCIAVIKKLMAGSPRQILHAAIRRTVYKIVESFPGTHSLRARLHNSSLRDIVYFIYAWLKRGGALEPDESFLRSSKVFHQQHLRENQAKPISLVMDNDLKASDMGCVLITATCEVGDSAGRQVASLCAYLTEGSPAATNFEDLAAILKKAIETRDVYHTTRTSTRSTNFTKLNSRFWNLYRQYGVYSHDFGFLSFLGTLSSEVPTVIGTSRSPGACGSQLYRRNIYPWTDPRYNYRNIQSQMFILYKFFTQEIRFWKGIAKERERSGMSCCRLCAALGEQKICRACREFLADQYQYEWFKNAVRGELPLSMKDLSDEEVKERFRIIHDDYLAQVGDIASRPRGLRRYDENIDWATRLDFYSKLNDNFNDIGELASQWQEFCRYCDKKNSYRSLGRAANRKRKRSEESSSEEAESTSSDPEEFD